MKIFHLLDEIFRKYEKASRKKESQTVFLYFARRIFFSLLPVFVGGKIYEGILKNENIEPIDKDINP
jgi:hypothetical protein